MLAVAYLRVSTDTDRQALGAEAQRVAIRQWAAGAGVDVAHWFVEEVSGGLPLDKRPILLEAIATAASIGAGVLVVQKLDRFSRDPLTAALAECELRKNGASLVCADGTASGDDPTSELIRGILLTVARFEKALIRSRIKAALAVKRSRGERIGAPPHGYRVEGKSLIADAGETETIARLRRFRAGGLRPSSLRPLRRKGATPDVLWDKSMILIRRSQTRGREVMNKTKTGVNQRITLPQDVMDVLRWHVEAQLATPQQQASDLLFPSVTGRFRAPSVLNKPFADVANRIGLGKKFTQRGLRRTFNDLARNANVEGLVTKSISGHLTDRMKDHYSTVSSAEQSEGIGRVVKLVERAPSAPANEPQNAEDGGMHRGMQGVDGGMHEEKAGEA